MTVPEFVPLTDCEHVEFAAEVDAVRLTAGEHVGAPVTGYTADVRIRCAACGTRFQFVGPDVGLSGARPMVSLDGCEVHLPMRPEGEDRAEPVAMPGFSVRVTAAGPDARPDA